MTDIVSMARAWLGTPYIHQAACRGAGCDCLGLIRGVWADLTGSSPPPVPPYTPDWSEPQGDERLWLGLSARLSPRPVGAARPGDVLLFRMRAGAVAKHLGILADEGAQMSFIHAWQGRGVVETALTAPWWRRLVAAFVLSVLPPEKE